MIFGLSWEINFTKYCSENAYFPCKGSHRSWALDSYGKIVPVHVRNNRCFLRSFRIDLFSYSFHLHSAFSAPLLRRSLHCSYVHITFSESYCAREIFLLKKLQLRFLCLLMTELCNFQALLPVHIIRSVPTVGCYHYLYKHTHPPWHLGRSWLLISLLFWFSPPKWLGLFGYKT